MADSIFTSETPSLTNANDGTRYTLCTLFRAAVDGTITHGRWYFPTTLPSSSPVFALYSRTSDAAGTEMARATFSDPVAGAWNTVVLASAQPVTAGSYYYAAVWTPDRYVATGGFFAGSAVTSGNLVAPADDTDVPRRNGRFNDFGTEPEYPDAQFGGGCYFADVVFVAGAVADARAGSTPTVAGGRTSLLTVAGTRTSLPTITAGRTSVPTVTGG